VSTLAALLRLLAAAASAAAVGRALLVDVAPAMTALEAAALDAYLAGATSFAEWGAGGSTWRAGRAASLSRVLSIESSAGWAAVAARGCAPPRCESRVVDVGPTGAYGTPVGDAARAQWPAYSRALAPGGGGGGGGVAAVDLVLVDGRFRVACAARALRAHPLARLLVHDWGRPAYAPVLAVADVVEVTGTLALLRRRADATDERLDALADEHEFDFA